MHFAINFNYKHCFVTKEIPTKSLMGCCLPKRNPPPAGFLGFHRAFSAVSYSYGDQLQSSTILAARNKKDIPLFP
jgi:hypothetical protein